MGEGGVVPIEVVDVVTEEAVVVAVVVVVVEVGGLVVVEPRGMEHLPLLD